MGNYPIQGPVYIPAGIKGIIPRKVGYHAAPIRKRVWFKAESRYVEPAGIPLRDERDHEVLPTPVPDDLPEGRTLRNVGDSVFDYTAYMPLD